MGFNPNIQYYKNKSNFPTGKYEKKYVINRGGMIKMSHILSDQELIKFEIYKQPIQKSFPIFVRPDVGWVALNF